MYNAWKSLFLPLKTASICPLMKIRLNQFGPDGDVPLVFIGPSGAGKSGRRENLLAHPKWKEAGWSGVEADEEIYKRLQRRIGGAHGKDGAEKLGRWLGRPWQPQFEENQALYLATEGKVMEQMLAMMEEHRALIMDLTGSSIYRPDLMAKFRESGFIVNFEPEESEDEEMFRKFQKEPKPICSNGAYRRAKGEKPMDALKATNRLVRAIRKPLYRASADITVNATPLRKRNGGTVETLTDAVKDEIRKVWGLI